MLGEEIKKKRKEANLTQQELAERVGGVTRQSVQKWEANISLPDEGRWADIERALGVSTGWLLIRHSEGKKATNLLPGREAPSCLNSSLRKWRLIPIISLNKVGEWQELADLNQPEHAEDWIETITTSSPHAFALVVSGDSMEPEFADGDIITVDPDRSAINGNFVIVRYDEVATFKQLVIDGASVFLKPLNSRYPIKDITGVKFHIVGVVVKKEKRYC